jgi:hypothetical protein
VSGGALGWRHIGHRIIDQVKKNDTEKRTLHEENRRLRRRLRRLEIFLDTQVDEVEQCCLCTEYVLTQDIAQCLGTDEEECDLYVCVACNHNWARTRCGCVGYCDNHKGEAAKRCPDCGREPKRTKN